MNHDLKLIIFTFIYTLLISKLIFFRNKKEPTKKTKFTVYRIK
jgi:hypothetical protein